VPVDELKALLEAQCEAFGGCNFGLFADLFRSPEAQNTAREVMEGWTAAQRAGTLSRMGWHDSLRDLAEWLYERWLNEERWQLEDVEDFEGPLNRTVAWYTANPMNLDRPESRAILFDYWRRAEGKAREELRDDLRDVPAAWAADRPEELRELAESFTLAHADLVGYHGAERLLQIAEEKLREVSRQRRADPDDHSPLDTMEFKRIVAMLADRPEPGVRERIRSLIACPDTDMEVRWEFCDYLWKERHEEMIALALAAAQSAGDQKLARRVLCWLADEPQPADRPLFWWAAFQEADWQLPYWAIQGLEQLRETSAAWRERLKDLSRSAHPFLRFQAIGALARRGERERLAEIARAAVEDEDPCVRGEAVRVLGQTGSIDYLDLMREALWAEGPVYRPEHDSFNTYDPAAEEAVLALARIGTSEALTALIQGFLFLPLMPPAPHWVQHAARNTLEVLIARMDGESRRFNTMHWNGWRREWFRFWPEPSFTVSE
jgi:hypothetical protein